MYAISKKAAAPEVSAKSHQSEPLVEHQVASAAVMWMAMMGVGVTAGSLG